jgi:hypothetical protein
MQIDRAALYERVWQKPMTSLAASFGISDVALKKKCLKAKIPVPERGYWAKVQAGKKVGKLALTERPPGMSRIVYIGETRYRRSIPSDEEILATIPESPTYDQTLDDIEAKITAAVGKLCLIRSLDAVHPAVGKLLSADDTRREKQAASRYSYAWDAPLFDGPFEVRRLRILNTLFRTAVKFGGTGDIRGQRGREISLSIYDTHVWLGVDTPANLKKDPRYANWDKTDARSKMRLIIRSNWSGDELFAWEDSERSKVEDHLSTILVNVIVTAEKTLRSQELHQHSCWLERRESIFAARRKALQEAERQRLELIERQRQASIDTLLGQAAALHQADTIRALVERAKAEKCDEDAKAFKRWSDWALGVADGLDPLRSTGLFNAFEFEPAASGESDTDGLD